MGRRNAKAVWVMRALCAAALACMLGCDSVRGAARCTGADVYIVPNTHGTATGWLVGFGHERNYMVNNYADLLRYVEAQRERAFAFSEVPTAIALSDLAPDDFRALRSAVHDGQAGLANAFYLETSVNLTQGETLLRMGVEGMRWQRDHFNETPQAAWLIDTVGTHRQMPEILAQIGVDAMVYGRNAASAQNVHIWRAPSGREALAIYAGSYANWRPYFRPDPPTPETRRLLQAELRNYSNATPSGTPSLWLVGTSDYSVAPPDGRLETAIADAAETNVTACMSTPSRYVEAVREAGTDALEVYAGDSLYSYNLFWFSNPAYKQRYRATESRLLGLESLTALQSINGAAYPAEALHRAWTLLMLNSDRALLWGIGSGAPFYGDGAWSALDRFNTIDAILDEIEQSARGADASAALYRPGVAARNDLIALQQPNRNAACDIAPGDDALTCSVAANAGAPQQMREIPTPEWIQAGPTRVRLDTATGDILAIVDAAGRNALGGRSSAVVLERQSNDHPWDFLDPPAQRQSAMAPDAGSARVHTYESTLRTLVVSTHTMGRGAASVERRMSIPRQGSRIDVTLRLRGAPEGTIAYARFDLDGAIAREVRGIPYGFSERALSEARPFFPRRTEVDHTQLGVHDTIAPAVRWSAYVNTAGVGLALYDRGTPGRETYQNQARLMLLASSLTYRGLANAGLDGSGETSWEFAIEPIFALDRSALAAAGRAYGAPVLQAAGALPELTASRNLSLESLRRYDRWLELRVVETNGAAGEGVVTLSFPHGRVEIADALGHRIRALSGENGRYRFAVRPQEIVTVRAALNTRVPDPAPLDNYEGLYPPQDAADMRFRDTTLTGHPPER